MSFLLEVVIYVYIAFNIFIPPNELVGCFGFISTLRQCFSQYRAVSQNRGRKKRNDRQEKKHPNNPHPHLLKAHKAFALLLFKLVGRPGTESYPAQSDQPRPNEIQHGRNTDLVEFASVEGNMPHNRIVS